MSEKTRLLKLAPEIKVGVKEIVAYLKQEGMKKVSASSFVGAEVVQDIKDHFSGKKTQKAKAAAAEKPTQAEAAEKPQPAPVPEVPAETEGAAEPATVETAPADAPAESAPPTVVEVKPAPPVPEIVPAAPPPPPLPRPLTNRPSFCSRPQNWSRGAQDRPPRPARLRRPEGPGAQSALRRPKPSANTFPDRARSGPGRFFPGPGREHRPGLSACLREPGRLPVFRRSADL